MSCFADCRSLLFVFAICFVTGCGNNKPLVISVSLMPSIPQTISPGGSLNISAAVLNDTTDKGVTWSLSPNIGTLSAPSSTSVTYVAPHDQTGASMVTVTATSVADSAESTPILVTVMEASVHNVQPVVVNGGPITNQVYINGPFTSVLLCVPGTSYCQVVGGLLVDTGSVGLRIFRSLLTIPLEPMTQSGGSVNNCVSFVDQQFLWGQIAPADVYLAGERAANVSVQLIADPISFSVPMSCSNGGIDGVLTRPFNGILGVGDEPTDCTFAGSNPCDPSAGNATTPLYYVCFSGQGCGATLVPKAQQVGNPVAAFPVDNNGTILSFPAVGNGLPNTAGNLTFGINTETNNDIGSAAVFAINPHNFFTTTFAGQELTDSFIDSGSNALLFPDITGIQPCPDNSFYCPAYAPLQLTAGTVGYGGLGTGVVNFSVSSYDADVANDPQYAAFGYIAGANGTPPCQNGQGGCSFDWGLPFFYNRSVFTSIDIKTVAGEPKTPWWAY